MRVSPCRRVSWNMILHSKNCFMFPFYVQRHKKTAPKPEIAGFKFLTPGRAVDGIAFNPPRKRCCYIFERWRRIVMSGGLRALTWRLIGAPPGGGPVFF